MRRSRPSFWLALLTLATLLIACSTGDQALSTDAELSALSVDDRYIVVLADAPSPAAAASVRADAAAFARGLGLAPERAYGAALVGFSARMTPQRAAALANHPRVAYVEADARVELMAQTVPTGIDRIFATENANLAINGADDFRVDVDVAVIDTGVDLDHPDLNVVGGVDCASGGPFGGNCSDGGDDDVGHGTHVAGTIGALDNGIGVVGVAPGARIWTVKVLGRRGGYTSWVIAGIDWVTANSDTIEVANMSLGGSGYSQAEYDAIDRAVQAGVAFAVSAGNDADEAANYSPAAFDNVLTVSALADFDGKSGGAGTPTCRNDQDETLADFSNFGSAVDIAAPGVCILSTVPNGGYDGSYSGTSMASPHVAGALALLASTTPPANAADVHALYDVVTNAGNQAWTDDSGDGILEPLLDVSSFTATLLPGDGGGVDDAAPSVEISSPTDGATFGSGTSITFTGTANDSEDGDLTSSLSWTSDLVGAIGSGGSFSVVLSDGTHQVTASVTDSGANAATASLTVTVGDDGSDGSSITLTVNAYKVRGAQHADLVWSGATSGNVDVYKSENLLETTANTGAYTDSTNQKGGGTATYQICEAGSTTVCSATMTAVW